MSDKSESFEDWLDEHGEGGIHLDGLSPREYGQAIWAAMRNHQQKKLQAAEEREKILREAVEFYADENNFRTDKNHVSGELYIEEVVGVEGYDMGKKARQALEKVASNKAGGKDGSR